MKKLLIITLSLSLTYPSLSRSGIFNKKKKKQERAYEQHLTNLHETTSSVMRPKREQYCGEALRCPIRSTKIPKRQKRVYAPLSLKEQAGRVACKYDYELIDEKGNRYPIPQGLQEEQKNIRNRMLIENSLENPTPENVKKLKSKGLLAQAWKQAKDQTTKELLKTWE